MGVMGTFDEIFLTFLSRKIRSLTDSGLLGLVEEFLDDLVALVSFDGNEEDRVEFEDDLDDLKHENEMLCSKTFPEKEFLWREVARRCVIKNA